MNSADEEVVGGPVLLAERDVGDEADELEGHESRERPSVRSLYVATDQARKRSAR